jgi:hypothetical protein
LPQAKLAGHANGPGAEIPADGQNVEFFKPAAKDFQGVVKVQNILRAFVTGVPGMDQKW